MKKKFEWLLKVIDTTDLLDQRAKDYVSTKLFEKYDKLHAKYPKAKVITVRPLGITGFVAYMEVFNEEELVEMNFSEAQLLSRAVKLPNRDMNDKNVR